MRIAFLVTLIGVGCARAPTTTPEREQPDIVVSDLTGTPRTLDEWSPGA